MDERVLSDRIRAAMEVRPTGRREQVECLLDLLALHLAPLETIGAAVEWQHDPRLAVLRAELERGFLARLDPGDPMLAPAAEGDVVDEFRRIAHDELVPPVYDWLARQATRADLVDFIAIEGGPDADFDDLVAICQVGLRGRPKLTLGANYWDEMGDGDLDSVHTELHARMVAALGVPTLSPSELPVEALERRALNGVLAVNRARQPELVGSLGLLECQAGPRCRRVVGAMERLGVPADALPFYQEHAQADPRHGKDWVDHAVAPIVDARPRWGARILRGAQWRALVNRRFFDAMEERFGLASRAA